MVKQCQARDPKAYEGGTNNRGEEQVKHIEINSKNHYTIYRFLNAGRLARRLKDKLRFFCTKENAMRLSAPKQITWIVAIVLGVLGLLGSLITIPVVSGLAFWLVFLGFLLLAVATFIDGL